MGIQDVSPGAASIESTKPLQWDLLRQRSLQPGGFGEERKTLWQRLLNVDPSATLSNPTNPTVSSDVKVEDISVVENAASESFEDDTNQISHRDERQIGLDTDRSFVLYPVECVRSREALQAELHKLIVAVFRRRQHLNYFQGYHDIVSVFYLTLPQELQVVSVEELSLHRLRDSMGTSLEPVVGLLRVLQRLLQAADPNFAALLETTAPLPYFALSNLLTLLSHDVPTLPLIQHIFDYLFCRHPVAIVYLVAAVVLSRRDEAFQLANEGDEGLIHSVLSSLPELYEEDIAAIPPDSVYCSEGHADVQNESIDASVDPEVASQIRESTEDTVVDHSDVVKSPITAQDEETSFTTDDPSLSESLSTISTVADYSTGAAEKESETRSDSAKSTDVETDAEQSRLSSGEDREIHDHPTEDSHDQYSSGKPLASRSPSPVPSDHFPPRPRVSLTSLLMHADELYSRFPPSHPSIALSSTMGPQSVMLTWSEDPSELPSGDDAELMVTKPELVVLPHIEPEDEVESDDASGYVHNARRRKEKTKDERDRDRRKRRKLRKPRHLAVERKTMVAGAVLVLGVAMAVYGLQAGSPATLFRDGFHQRHSVEREWKRLSKVVGGLVLGVGERMLDGILR